MDGTLGVGSDLMHVHAKKGRWIGKKENEENYWVCDLS